MKTTRIRRKTSEITRLREENELLSGGMTEDRALYAKRLAELEAENKRLKDLPADYCDHCGTGYQNLTLELFRAQERIKELETLDTISDAEKTVSEIEKEKFND